MNSYTSIMLARPEDDNMNGSKYPVFGILLGGVLIAGLALFIRVMLNEPEVVPQHEIPPAATGIKVDLLLSKSRVEQGLTRIEVDGRVFLLWRSERAAAIVEYTPLPGEEAIKYLEPGEVE